MELINPGLGLFFWMVLFFGIVFFILKKFVWPPILQSLKDREQHIEESLQLADSTREEMKKLKLDSYAASVFQAMTDKTGLTEGFMPLPAKKGRKSNFRCLFKKCPLNVT